MSYTKEQRIINNMNNSTKAQRSQPVDNKDTGGLVIPNHSGDHSAGEVLSTPVNDNDIVNKKYVDDSVGIQGSLHGTKTEEEIFEALSPSIPNINDEIIINGNAVFNSRDRGTSKGVRISETEIEIYWGGLGTFSTTIIEDNDATNIDLSIAW